MIEAHDLIDRWSGLSDRLSGAQSRPEGTLRVIGPSGVFNVGVGGANQLFTHLQGVGSRTPLPLSYGETYLMVAKIESAGGHPRVDIFPQGGHDCWDEAYSKGDLFQWMMSQRRAGAAAAAPVMPVKTSAATPALNTAPVSTGYVRQMPAAN